MTRPSAPRSQNKTASRGASAELFSGLTTLFSRVVLFAIDGVEARVVRTHGVAEGLVGRTFSLVDPTPLRWAIEAASPTVEAGRSPGGLELCARLGLTAPRAFAVIPIVIGGRVRALAYGDRAGEALALPKVAELFAWCSRLLGETPEPPPPSRWMFTSTRGRDPEQRAGPSRPPGPAHAPADRGASAAVAEEEEEHERQAEATARTPVAPAPPAEAPAPPVEVPMPPALAPEPPVVAPALQATSAAWSEPASTPAVATGPLQLRAPPPYRAPRPSVPARTPARRVFTMAALAGFVVTCVVVASPPSASSRHALVTIHEPPSAAEVGRALKRAELIRSPLVAQLLLTAGGPIAAGSYKLNTGRWPWQHLEALRVASAGLTTASFSPGATLSEIATELARLGVADEDELLDASRGVELRTRWGIEAPSIEGFLYPGTYRFAAGLSAPELLEVMLTEQFRHLRSLPDAVHLQGAALRDLVTLASVVEREATDKRELARIAGVLRNRLDKRMRLESPATVRFIVGEPKARLTVEDVRQPSPYNTYVNEGLPPAPIGNPSQAALAAALKPERHEFLYFMERDEPAGGHRFSATYEEHLRALRSARRNGVEPSKLIIDPERK